MTFAEHLANAMKNPKPSEKMDQSDQTFTSWRMPTFRPKKPRSRKSSTQSSRSSSGSRGSDRSRSSSRRRSSLQDDPEDLDQAFTFDRNKGGSGRSNRRTSTPKSASKGPKFGGWRSRRSSETSNLADDESGSGRSSRRNSASTSASKGSQFGRRPRKSSETSNLADDFEGM